METSDEQQERERLRAENTELATLAGGLAHEIRNPLSTIGMSLELLAEEMEGDDSQRARRVIRRISSLQGECRNLEEILNAFLHSHRVLTLPTFGSEQSHRWERLNASVH